MLLKLIVRPKLEHAALMAAIRVTKEDPRFLPLRNDPPDFAPEGYTLTDVLSAHMDWKSTGRFFESDLPPAYHSIDLRLAVIALDRRLEYLEARELARGVRKAQAAKNGEAKLN